MIYTVTLNPALDKTVEIPSLTVDAVNRVASFRTDAGGKGINVSKVISKMGGKSIAAGILGGDTGRIIRLALNEMGIASCFHFVEGETRTNLKIIDPDMGTNTDINEPGPTVSEETLSGLLKELTEKVSGGDIVVLAGSIPQGAPKDIYYKWTKTFRQKDAKVILDADGDQLKAGIKASPFLIKPNEHELSELTGEVCETPEEIAAAAEKLMKKYGITMTVVSLGSKGALYITDRGTIWSKGLNVPVRSTVGAGDSMVAALAMSQEEGKCLEDMIRLSMAAGAANVMSGGTQAAEYEVIRNLIPQVDFEWI